MKDLKDKKWSDSGSIMEMVGFRVSSEGKVSKFSDKWDEEYEIEKDVQISPRFLVLVVRMTELTYSGLEKKWENVNWGDQDLNFDTLVWLVDSYLHF